MEQKPVTLYQFTDSNRIEHFYYDNGYIWDYDQENEKDLGLRKMTEEDHKFLNERLDSMREAFNDAYEGMTRMSKDVEAKKFRD